MTPFITTFTGRRVNPLDLHPRDIVIEDIAHALACCNRFAGHAKYPLSVAQHCVFVSLLSPERALQGLLHDASEAYLGDVTKWLKSTMPEYRAAEDRAMETILQKYGCDIVLHEDVLAADVLMVRFEFEAMWGKPLAPDGPYGPLTDKERFRVGAWSPVSWPDAERAFLARFRELRHKK